MRLFIAINLSSAMKDALINIQNAFYDAGVRGNYTSEENLHLTLAFIGEYPDAESVMDSLAAVSFTPWTQSCGESDAHLLKTASRLTGRNFLPISRCYGRHPVLPCRP